MATFTYSLDIQGLAPRNTALMPGGVYAVIEEDARFANALILQSLLHAYSQGRHAYLATATDPAKSWGNQNPLIDKVRHAVATSGITIFQYQADASDKPKDFVTGLFDDLAHFRVTKKEALLVLDGAERLFSGQEQEDSLLMRRLRDASEQTSGVILLIFRPSVRQRNDTIAHLLPCSRFLSGLARIRSAYGAVGWEIFHWFGNDGMTGAQSCQLALGASGALSVIEDSAPVAQIAPAADDHNVYAVRSLLLPAESAPGAWQTVNDMDTLEKSLENAVAATVLLVFNASIAFDRLARCVFALRAKYGPRLKIVIREVNVRLRYSQETLAIRLGANLIVPAEVSYSRFLSLTEMIQGQIYPHRLQPTYEQAVADAMPEQEQGYLPPAEFVEAVISTIDASRALNMQNILLRLPLGYGLGPLDALRHCSIKRAGDLCTSDDYSVYIFLYACRESDVSLTLDRLFKLPVAEFFSSESRYFSPLEIQTAIEELSGRCAADRFPDLTLALSSATEQPISIGREKNPLPSLAEKKGMAEIKHAAPPPAKHRPLTIRTAPSLVDISTTLT